jgi:hypothetical protein
VDLLVGIDLGTSSVKVVAIDAGGKLLANAARARVPDPFPGPWVRRTGARDLVGSDARLGCGGRRRTECARIVNGYSVAVDTRSRRPARERGSFARGLPSCRAASSGRPRRRRRP